jgi:predicted outer membrane repeat protein
MGSKSNGIGLSRVSKVSWTKRCLASAPMVASLLAWSASAQAAVYTVLTNGLEGNGAMEMDDSDGYCSLAEAIASVNEGSPQTDECVDSFPGSSAIIQFQEAAGKPFADNPFIIKSLAIEPEVDVALIGSGAHIHSTGGSGLFIYNGASVELSGLTMTYTGTAGGRLILNQGELAISSSTLKNGNVTPLQGGLGGAIYNGPTGVISYVGADVSLVGNKAKRGGAIYNNAGRIDDLRGLIQGNSATMAGGGIYNLSTAFAGGPSNGIIYANGVTIMKNSAKAGGGVFNRGYFQMTGGSITLNNVSGTGSGETCTAGQSCDGAGGGIVSAPPSSTLAAGFVTGGGVTIAANTATGLGGAIYTAGLADLLGVKIVGNRALSGAAIYAVPQGMSFYCQIGSSSQRATFTDNAVTVAGPNRYSILDGLALQPNTDLDRCTVTNAVGSGNPSPRCNPDMLFPGGAGVPASVCPQSN